MKDLDAISDRHVQDVVLRLITTVGATVRDRDLAECLGFVDPRNIRKLIGRLYPDPATTQRRIRITSHRTRNGGIIQHKANEYWLTREQALNVAAHSKTHRAQAVFNAMTVFKPTEVSTDESTQETPLASKTQDDSFNSKLLDIFRAPVTKASAQVEAIKSAADSWQSTVEGLVMARAARLMGTSLPGDAEEKSRNALSDLLAAVEAVDGMPELMREMLGASTPTPALAPVRAVPTPAPSTSSPSSPLSGDSAAMEPDPVVPQPPRPLALATSIHDRAMIDLKPRRWPKTTKAALTKPVLIVSGEKAALAAETILRSEAIVWTWDVVAGVQESEVIASRIKSGKYSGVIVFSHAISGGQHSVVATLRAACESSRTPFTSALKQGTGSTVNALETIESELKKATT